MSTSEVASRLQRFHANKAKKAEKAKTARTARGVETEAGKRKRKADEHNRELKKMRVTELRQLLRDRGEDTVGKKAELIERLAAAALAAVASEPGLLCERGPEGPRFNF